MHKLLLLYQQVVVQIFLHFIQIGLFQDGKLDISNGQILLMGNLYMYLLKIQDL